MRKTLAHILLASTSALSAPRRMAEGQGEEGAPADPSGITREGATTQFTPQEGEAPLADPNAPAPERQPEWPEGVNSWEEFGKLSPEERVKAISAAHAKTEGADATKIETQGTEGEVKQGLDLIVAQTLEGVSPEMAPKVEPFVRKFAEAGTLTDAEVAEAAKQTGFSEAMVRQFMAGGEAQAAAAAAPFYALTDGAENYAGFQKWAGEALGPDDHAKINKALDDGKPEALQSYVDAWKASGHAPAPRDLTTEARTTDPANAQDTGGYASQAEMSAAMNNPKYRTDPAYRKEVERKVGLSNF